MMGAFLLFNLGTALLLEQFGRFSEAADRYGLI